MMLGAIPNASSPMGGAGSRKGLSDWGPTLQRGAFRSSLDIKGKVQRIRCKKDAPSGYASTDYEMKFDCINDPKLWVSKGNLPFGFGSKGLEPAEHQFAGGLSPVFRAVERFLRMSSGGFFK